MCPLSLQLSSGSGGDDDCISDHPRRAQNWHRCPLAMMTSRDLHRCCRRSVRAGQRVLTTRRHFLTKLEADIQVCHRDSAVLVVASRNVTNGNDVVEVKHCLHLHHRPHLLLPPTLFRLSITRLLPLGAYNAVKYYVS